MRLPVRAFIQSGLLSIALIGWLAASASAQDNSEDMERTVSTVKTLPEHSGQTLMQLTNLMNFPDGEWRVHEGDVPHGESFSLDDAAWEVVKAGAKISEGSLWFRRWIEVPRELRGYDLTGTRIWFSLHVKGSGAQPEIVYFNGRRVALGEGLEPVVLFENAKPGEKILVAVKLANNGASRVFAGAEYRIDFAESRPNPEELREELLSAALLIPSLSKNVEGDKATLERSIAAIDMEALQQADQQKFDDSLRRSASTLAVLRPMLRQLTYYEDGNSHIDAAWRWPVSETQDVVRRTFTTALQLMNEYPQYIFTQSTAAYNDWIAEKYAPVNDTIRRRIAAGRWEVVGGMWVEPDLNMPDGESQVRSILLGKRFFEKQYGVDIRVGWNPDSFGYNWQTPQIYKKTGIDFFVTQKMDWNETNKLPFKLFWWESPDGSKVLTYFPQDYDNTDMNPVRLAQAMTAARKAAPGLTEMMDLYGVGDHGGGPTREILDEGMRWQSPEKIIPTMRFGSALGYFLDVSGKLAAGSRTWDYDSIAKGYQYPAPPAPGLISVPTWKSELYLEFHRGTYTTHADHKSGMRRSEVRTINAEKYASLAWLFGDPYPGEALNEAWKKVAFNGFHDLAAGSGVSVIYKDSHRDFEQVRLATEEISSRALSALARHVNTGDQPGVPVMVFNQLAWERDAVANVEVQMPVGTNSVVVTDPQGEALPMEQVSADQVTNTFRILVRVKKLPSLGYQVLHVMPGSNKVQTDLRVSGLTMENAALRVKVDKKTGCITSIFDKRSNFESLAAGACGNDLEFFKDTPKKNDAWNIDPGTLDAPPDHVPSAESVELVASGPLRAAIRVIRKWQSSRFDQQIELDASADHVKIVNDIDWHETHVLVKSAFPLAAASAKATYEIPFGTIERPTTRNNSWDGAQFEVPALRWADLGDGSHGFSLINDSKYGYDAVGNLLRLSLLRAPVEPDPDADRGHHHFSFALYPHSGSWKDASTMRHGYEFNVEPAILAMQQHVGDLPLEKSFVSVQPGNVILSALKKAEDSDALVAHIYETEGKASTVELTIPEGASKAVETNLLEIPQESQAALKGEKLSIPIRPYEILAVRFDYPHAKE
jgi:alpha-mannosidase